MVGLWIQKMVAVLTLMNVQRRGINARLINFVSTVKGRTNAWNVINHAVDVPVMVPIYATNVLMDLNYAMDYVKVSFGTIDKSFKLNLNARLWI